MNPRIVTLAVSILGCALLIGAASRQRELIRLRAQNQQVIAELESARNNAAAEATEVLPASPADDAAKIELLRLRNEVSQLMERTKGLASIRAENQTLQTRLAAKGTNNLTGLPPGYLRTRDAEWVGTGTPENTLQSFLWAIKQRDQARLMQLLAPTESSLQLSNHLHANPGEFFTAGNIPGLRPIQKETLPDGSVSIKLELMPGEVNFPDSTIRFKNINGEWKMDF
jgi:hypothetical protein